MKMMLHNLIWLAANVMFVLLFARCLISWAAATWTPAQLSRFHPISQFIERVTEPILAPIRRYLPTVSYGYTNIDLSPAVAMLLIWLTAKILTKLFVF